MTSSPPCLSAAERLHATPARSASEGLGSTDAVLIPEILRDAIQCSNAKDIEEHHGEEDAAKKKIAGLVWQIITSECDTNTDEHHGRSNQVGGANNGASDDFVGVVQVIHLLSESHLPL